MANNQKVNFWEAKTFPTPTLRTDNGSNYYLNWMSAHVTVFSITKCSINVASVFFFYQYFFNVLFDTLQELQDLKAIYVLALYNWITLTQRKVLGKLNKSKFNILKELVQRWRCECLLCIISFNVSFHFISSFSYIFFILTLYFHHGGISQSLNLHFC